MFPFNKRDKSETKKTEDVIVDNDTATPTSDTVPPQQNACNVMDGFLDVLEDSLANICGWTCGSSCGYGCGCEPKEVLL
jgi:hypothetical protein